MPSAPKHSLHTLKGSRCWVPWGLNGGSKVPYSATGQGVGSATDPRTWGRYAEAERRASAVASICDGGGVGLVLGALDKGPHVAGIDLDSCRDLETGEFTPWARDVIELLDSYTEISPSKTGAKIFFEISRRELSKVRKALGGQYGKSWKKAGRKHPEGIELYLGKRYFTVTHDHLQGTPTGFRKVPLEDVMGIIQSIGPRLVEASNHLDNSRSGRAFRLAQEGQRRGKTIDWFREELAKDAELADWARDGRQVDRAWHNAGAHRGTGELAVFDGGNIIPNLANAAQVLRTDPSLTGVFGFDEMSNSVVLKRRLPLEHRSHEGLPRGLQDTDVLVVQEYLQKAGLKRLGKEPVQGAIDLVGRENSFHPVRDYLAGLEWDGTPRVDTWLSSYLGAEDCEYARGIGRMFLIAAVTRIDRPGCKFDYMLILEGAQGVGKSTACSILGGEWFSDSLPDFDEGKDLFQHLRGKWIIEIGELQAMRKAENTLLKSLISRTTERYRPPYGRNEVVEPRQCVFMGTTNTSTYLQDETGGRRFWPVTVGPKIDLHGLRRDRDQLWAEAQYRCDWMEDYWPTREFEHAFLKPAQEERHDTDAWEGTIREFVADKTKITVSEIATQCLQLPISVLDKSRQLRIARCLRRLGWEPGRDSKSRFWIRHG